MILTFINRKTGKTKIIENVTFIHVSEAEKMLALYLLNGNIHFVDLEKFQLMEVDL